MYLLQASNLLKAFGARTLFEIERVEVHDGDRIGLVGPNGAGKSTLLDLLYGAAQPDGGVVERRCPMALVRQTGEAEGEADGKLLRSLELTGCACKSGGERTKLAVAAAFSQGAPLLLADEPTTNLDREGVQTLQGLITGYRGAVVLVSHDRALLDGVCTCIWALEDGKLRVFPGNYSAWIAQRDREREFAQFEYEQYRTEKKRLQAEVLSLREQTRGMLKAPRRMGNSEARLLKGSTSALQGKLAGRAGTLLARAERLEAKERPSDLPQVRMALGACGAVTSKTAARIEGLTVRHGGRAVLKNASFSLPTGSHTVMLGANGAGKTTLLEHLVSGGERARISGGVKLGYFAQNHEILDPEKTILENVRESSSLAEHEVRTILANLYLPGDEVFKPVRVLSGGERAKAAFAKLLASDCNLLVLDEPTNHIDLYTVEALERLLREWQGTLLVVSHDRRLTERVADHLLFVENGAVRAFSGGWAAWEEEERRLQRPRDDLGDLVEQLRRAAEAGGAPV